MSVESTQWKNYSAVPTHHIFGRQYKFGIRSMQLITRNYILHVVQEIKEKKDEKSQANSSSGQKYSRYGINQRRLFCEMKLDLINFSW